MKKQEIKKDVIRDRIIGFANYISNNTASVWITIGVMVTLILAITFFSNQSKNNLLKSNLAMGLVQNRAINDISKEDSLLLQDYKNILENPISHHDYNQAFIYLINNAVKNDDKDYIVNLLSDNQFSSKDDMLKAFLYRIKALYLYSEDMDNCARYYKKAIELVPSYDFKIIWATDLIDLYLEDTNYDEADNTLQLLKDLIGDEENLSLSEKNNLNFIESKISQLIN